MVTFTHYRTVNSASKLLQSNVFVFEDARGTRLFGCPSPVTFRSLSVTFTAFVPPPGTVRENQTTRVYGESRDVTIYSECDKPIRTLTDFTFFDERDGSLAELKYRQSSYDWAVCGIAGPLFNNAEVADESSDSNTNRLFVLLTEVVSVSLDYTTHRE